MDSLSDGYRLKAKSLAICSGKGGVGKTVTAANLSIYYARQGLRVGLVDLDPLSDIATLFDAQESESALKEDTAGKSSLEDYVLPIFPRLDLLFPAPKLGRKERQGLLGRIYGEYPQELSERFDILIFDLPAGSDFEENLAFLPFMKVLLLVTNPEPTAHAAAGAYVRRALELYPELTVHIWHNRFSGERSDGFDPLDLIGNYNRNVPEEQRLGSLEAARLRDFCFIPEDPSLNLLRGEPDAVMNLLHRMTEVLRLVHAERLTKTSHGLAISRKSLDLVRYYVNRNRNIDQVEGYLEGLGGFLSEFLRANLSRLGQREEGGPAARRFSPEEELQLRAFLQAARDDSVRQSVVRLLDLLEERTGRLRDSSRLFHTRGVSVADKAADREISRFLLELNGLPRREEEIRRLGSLLLFYFALYKLFQSPAIARFVGTFIPKKKDHQGRPVRDRRAQIRSLLETGAEHRKEFLRLIRTLYPILTRQLTSIVRVFRLEGLLFRDRQNVILRKAYLNLLTHFTHDTLYSGLSVVVGFSYRPASSAFQRGADKALELLREPLEDRVAEKVS